MRSFWVVKSQPKAVDLMKYCLVALDWRLKIKSKKFRDSVELAIVQTCVADAIYSYWIQNGRDSDMLKTFEVTQRIYSKAKIGVVHQNQRPKKCNINIYMYIWHL